MTGNDNARLPSPDHLAVELARLRAENAQLREALRVNGRYARRIGRARDNALLLGTWHCAFLETSRSACLGRGMAQRAWEGAVALLRLARCIDGRGRWKLHTLAEIDAAIQRAADRAAADPNAFFMRGNKHLRRREATE